MRLLWKVPSEPSSWWMTKKRRPFPILILAETHNHHTIGTGDTPSPSLVIPDNSLATMVTP